MLTNDARNYNAYFAQFWRLKPKLSITEGGLGAWEVALRASTIDLNDSDINGGEASSYTLGLNWYMTTFTKTILNIVHTESSGALSEDFNVLGIRLQIEF
jgi:phosphate-selective porin OprO/OprP